MSSKTKLYASLTLAVTVIGLSLIQTYPVAATSTADPAHTAVEAATLPGVGILVGAVCLIFAAMAVLPMLIGRRPTR
jgi:hypothetical protein